MRFYRRVKFEPLGIPRMYVRNVQVEELIRLIECLELHDGAVSRLSGGELPRGGIQLIVAAQCAAGETVTCPHRSGGIVAEVCHALRDGLDIEWNLVAVSLVEHLRMDWIASRLNHGEGRIGAL